MRVTLHHPAENPILSLFLSCGWPPKVARDITRPVTCRLAAPPRAPTHAALGRGLRGSEAGSPAPAPESPRVAPRPRTRAGRCPLPPSASSLGTAPAGAALRLDTSLAPRRDDPSPADCAVWFGTSHSRRLAPSPRAGRAQTSCRKGSTFDSGSAFGDASIERPSHATTPTLLGPTLTPRWSSPDPTGSRRRREVDLGRAAAKVCTYS